MKAERERVEARPAPLTTAGRERTRNGSSNSIPKSVLAQAAPALGLACDPAWQRSNLPVRLRSRGRDPMKAAILGLILGLLAALFIGNVKARDLGQWENSDPAIRQWFQTLMRPDMPGSICCKESDAYWADDFYVRNGKMYARVTDDRDDGPLGRPHIANGTEFEIPPEKLKHDAGNPTGHAVLFVSSSGFTYCYVQGSGT
jgi:hypothetical protein